MSYQAINTAYLDHGVRPQDDFYRFVNGTWMSTTEIPEDRERWGSFDDLRKRTDVQMQELVADILAGRLLTDDADAQKAIDMIRCGMDMEQVEATGASALEPWLSRIDSIGNHQDIKVYLLEALPAGMSSLFQVSVFAGLDDSSAYSWYLGGPSLGMPERDYYLDDTEPAQVIRKQYEEYIEQLSRVAGLDATKAAAILALETSLARLLLSKEDSRNPHNIFNPTSLTELGVSYPLIDWQELYVGAGVQLDTRMIVTEKRYFEQVQQVLYDTEIGTVKAYLAFAMVNSAAPYMSSSYVDTRFDFYGRKLGGTEQLRPRIERVVAVTTGVMGEALGKLYVDRHFSERSKAKALELVDEVLLAFKTRIEDASWMQPATKVKALAKLASFKVKIGYPDTWRDYSQLQLVSPTQGGTYLSSIMEASRYRWLRDTARIGDKVDQGEWHMAPQVVNAYYSPLANEIVFPAAILQAPFYDVQADAAVNFGGIGAVIAHEISHGFDDQGRRFDAQGNMVEWWTPEDVSAFAVLGEQLVAQADTYHILPDLTLNGTFTLGENLADLGGVVVSYEALQSYQNKYGLQDPIDGYTADQRFFMSWATVWRGKTREAALRKQVATDPHPPFEFRGNNPLRNVESYYRAWNVTQDDDMYLAPEQRVTVW